MAILRHTTQFLGRRLISKPNSNHGSLTINVRPTHNPHPRRLLNVNLRRLSDSPHKSKSTNEHPQNPTLPGFSFEALGVGPRMRIFLIVILCIFSTIETLTWATFIYNRFYKKDDEEDGDDALSN
jgi:hypothetical protein